jgi:hypothetical protein
MGAIIADAILQPGLNYQSVVAPRVKRLQTQFPEAVTTSLFLSVIREIGAREVLSWTHPEKPRRLVALTRFLLGSDVETWIDLRRWLAKEDNRARLLSVRGVGPKTCDYIATLVGLPAVAVDRHISAFVRSAGLTPCGYTQTRDIVIAAAEILHVDVAELDHAIWAYARRVATAAAR